MKHRAFPFLVLSFLLLVLAACGSPEPTTTNATNRNAGSTNVNSPGSGTNTPQEVRIVMGEMYFKPAIATFKVGQPYKFVLVNEGKSPHEFTIAPPRKADQTEKDLDELSLIDADDLDGGQTRTIDFTFKQPAPAGTLEFECSYPGHYEGGMHIPIIVEQ
jgi:uncharacterized cupredoxin-like copper-binding protein